MEARDPDATSRKWGKDKFPGMEETKKKKGNKKFSKPTYLGLPNLSQQRFCL
jgi:hypothetical protein